MNSLCILFMVATLLAVCSANPPQKGMRSKIVNGTLKPSDWLTPNELENTPSMDEFTLQQLEDMPLEKGAYLIRKWYHLSQINHELLSPNYVPRDSNIPVYIVKSDSEREVCQLNNLVETVQKQPNFGNEEVTVFITGLPSTTETIKKANRKLIEAYLERYNSNNNNNNKQKEQKRESYKDSNEQTSRSTSSEENYSSENRKPKSTSGNLIIIDLGETLNKLERYAQLNVDETGTMIGKTLFKLTSDCDVPYEIIHIVAQGIAAHVAGAAANEYTRLSGRQLRRITALDPSKIMATNHKVLSGLSRGDAEFIDAIHTSAYGLGTLSRVGDIDFFPNGPCTGGPGARNVIEASLHATRYFAESLRRGNERNFPAVEAKSMEQYKDNNGFGKRTYMGIATDFDLRGDYMLEVNKNSPFGMRAPARKQKPYHGVHKTWAQDSN